MPVVFGYNGSWGDLIRPGCTSQQQPLMVCTDGSFIDEEGVRASSWALCVVDDWVKQRVSDLPLEADMALLLTTR